MTVNRDANHERPAFQGITLAFFLSGLPLSSVGIDARFLQYRLDSRGYLIAILRAGTERGVAAFGFAHEAENGWIPAVVIRSSLSRNCFRLCHARARGVRVRSPSPPFVCIAAYITGEGEVERKRSVNDERNTSHRKERVKTTMCPHPPTDPIGD